MVKNTEKSDETRSSNEVAKINIKINFWMISTAVLALILIVILVRGGITGAVTGALSKEQAGDKVLQLVNDYLIQDGTATLDSVSDESGLYKVNLNYNSNKIPVYITKDSKSLILPNGIMSIAELEATAQNAGQEQPTEITKTDKPTVELFVMSFCPYGVQAENELIPVAKLLGSKADIKIRFIASVSGDKVEDVSSLHGLNEAKEDLRQLAIMKYYPDKFWDYLAEINKNGYPVSSDAAKLDEAWKAAAKKLSIDTAKIESVAYGKEGIDLLKMEEQAANKYGVSGSPTLIINGVVYSGSRSADAFKEGICSAFTTLPAECSQKLESSGSASTTASGGCA